MRLCAIAFCLGGANAAAGATANDLYQVIDRLRGGEARCSRAADLPPLTVRPELERAAAALAKGRTLAQAVLDAGYRATRSAAISLSGEGVRAQAGEMLRSRYCAQIAVSSIADIGIYQDARQVWIVLAAPFAPRISESEDSAAQNTLALVNRARAVPRNCGDKPFAQAGPLRWNDTLAGAAQVHAKDMARHSYFSHKSRDGSTPAQRLTRAGYRYSAMGENIAAGQTTSAEAVAGWIRSPGHCANLMSPAYTEMGVAFAVNPASDMGVYWTQVFGAPQ